MSDEIKRGEEEAEMEEPDIITLEDEDGNEVQMEVLAEFPLGSRNYMAVVECVENEKEAEDAQLIFLEVKADDQGEYYELVDDDEQLEKLGKEFERLMGDEYDVQG